MTAKTARETVIVRLLTIRADGVRLGWFTATWPGLYPAIIIAELAGTLGIGHRAGGLLLGPRLVAGGRLVRCLGM